MCVHARRTYRVAQLTVASAGTFAAAAVLNVLSPADWSVSQEVELAAAGLAGVLRRRVAPTASCAVHVVVHANHIELLIECDEPGWVDEPVRVRPRRPFETAVDCAIERPEPPASRPALWPELAGPRGREDWSVTFEALAGIVQSANDDTGPAAVLDRVGRGIVATTCFTVVAINLVVDGAVEVVSVVGDDAAREAMLGVVEPERHWRALLARGTGWGALRFSGAQDPLPTNDAMTSWRAAAVGADADGWDAGGTLVAPLYVEGRFTGALSVDLPGGAERPRAQDLAKLEAFAEHAATVIDRVRVAR